MINPKVYETQMLIRTAIVTGNDLENLKKKQMILELLMRRNQENYLRKLLI